MRKQEIKYFPSVPGGREFEKRAQVRYNGPDKEFASIVPAFVLWTTGGQAMVVSGYSIVVIRDLPKVKRGVRFPLPAHT